MLELGSEENAVLLPVKVVPGASRTRYLVEYDKRARIAVAAPAERGKANKAVIALLANLLGVRRRDLTIVRGAASAVKTIRIERVTARTVRAALQPSRRL